MKVVKPQPSLGQSVDVWGLNLAALVSDVPPAEIVRKEHDEIGGAVCALAIAAPAAVAGMRMEIQPRPTGSTSKPDGPGRHTLVLFTADSGACAEWDPYGFDINSGSQNKLHHGPEVRNIGQPGTYHSYGSAWANACNTPLRLYKRCAHEGGICSPLIAHWPKARLGAMPPSLTHYTSST